MQRWLERSGGHYAFEQGAKRETLLISNDIGSLCSTSTAGAAGDAATASGADSAAAAAKSCVDLYDRKANTSSSAWTAWDVSKEVSRTPKRVAIDAYTPNPSLSLACEKEIGASVSGFGTLFRYDEDHTSAATGETLVKLLAQRELSEHVLIRGCTDCTTLRAGQIFTLKDVPNHADADYLVLGLELEAGEPIDGSFSATQDRGGHPAAAQGDKARAFVARFTAVPASVSHRPRLKTPRPSIQGLVRGFIDDDGTNTTKLYKQGCYSVVVPFDTNFRTKSRVARTMPMVRGYLGPGHGQRLPLRKGAEVMIAHIDGDPDRPVIVGAVMNEHITGPPAVFNEPALETESGIRIEFDDQQS